MRTANCYVVNAPGTYSLPLVYGNAIDAVKVPAAPHHNTSSYISNATGYGTLKNFVNHQGNAITDPYIYKNAGCTPDNAVLVWQDAKDLVTPASITLTDDDGDGIKDHMQFAVDQSNIKQGNAVLAVRDASNTIMWSWHIWVTDHKLEEYLFTITTDREHRLLPMYIGWCHSGSEGYAARRAKVRFRQIGTDNIQIFEIIQRQEIANFRGRAPYYSPGRKDPYLPADINTKQNVTWYDQSGVPSQNFESADLGEDVDLVVNFIKYPFVAENFVKIRKRLANLWSEYGTISANLATKTIYDPSPSGFRVVSASAFLTESNKGYLDITYDASEYSITISDGSNSLNISAMGVRRNNQIRGDACGTWTAEYRNMSWGLYSVYWVLDGRANPHATAVMATGDWLPIWCEKE